MTATMLKRVHKGVREGPFKGLIYGPEKVGKTMFTLGSPKPIVADIEGRVDHLDCASVPIKTWDEMMALAEELRTADHDYETLVVDSISVLEQRLRSKVIEDGHYEEGADGRNGAEAWGGQWFSLGYNLYWPQFWAAMERLQRERGMTIWYTCHIREETMTDPKGGEGYTRFRPSIGGSGKRSGTQRWLHEVDVVLFAEMEDIIRKQKGKGFARDKVVTSTTGRRIAHTTHHPAYDAGNSWNLPETIALDYAEFDQGRRDGPQAVSRAYEQLVALCDELDEDRRAKMLAYASQNRGDLVRLQGAIARVEKVLEEESEAESAAAGDSDAKTTTKEAK